MKLHTQLLLALAGGLTAGALAHAYGNSTAVDFVAMHLLRPIGQIFLRTIFMIVVPMVFAALVVGVYDLGQEHGLGTIARRTLAFTLLLSTTSVALGMGVVNLVRPGAGMAVRLQDPPAGMPPGQTPPAPLPEAKPLSDVLIELVPRNPLGSAVQALDGEMLPLMVFAVIFGLAVSGSRAMRPERHLLVRVLDEVFDACMRVVGFAMRFAPVAVFAIVFNTARTFGAGVFYALLLYVATVVLGLLLQQVFVYGALLRLVARRSPARFFRECRDVYLYAFSTASSNATLPLALQAAETRLRLSPQISRFVLTIGSTANQNGTALFEGVTVLFLAQAYGLDLSPGQQVRVMVMSIVAGVGTAGVPGGSLPMVMIVAQSVGVPAEGLALILGVDRFLDMCRTAVNVSGDLVIAALVNTHDSEHGHREHH